MNTNYETLLNLLKVKFPNKLFEISTGKKYAKLMRVECGKYHYAIAFIDMENGNVYKAASFNAPNKRSCVNINNIDKVIAYIFIVY